MAIAGPMYSQLQFIWSKIQYRFLSVQDEMIEWNA